MGGQGRWCKTKVHHTFYSVHREEQGLVGLQHYVDVHKDELPKISAALIDDTGNGKVLSIGMMAIYQDRAIMD